MSSAVVPDTRLTLASIDINANVGFAALQMPVLEPPQQNVADAEEHQYQPDPAGNAIFDHPVQDKGQSDRRQDDAFAEVRPDGMPSRDERLLIDRRPRGRG